MLSAVRARQLFRIHRWTGLATGLFILFLSLTGAGLVFIVEIDRALNRDLLVSEPSGAMVTPDRAVLVLGLTTGFLSVSGFLLWYIKSRRPVWAVRRIGSIPARSARVA